MRLPVELVVIVSQFLLGDGRFGSVANLNATCKVIQEETRSALYTTLIWDCERFSQLAQMVEEASKSDVEQIVGWRHVKWVSGSAFTGKTKEDVCWVPAGTSLSTIFPLAQMPCVAATSSSITSSFRRFSASRSSDPYGELPPSRTTHAEL